MLINSLEHFEKVKQMSKIVFCYNCHKKTKRTYPIREMSKRAGNYLCPECHKEEVSSNRAMNRLCA